MLGEQTVVFPEVGQDSPAYRSGWHDGRFDAPVSGDRLAEWTEPDRLAYHRGHRDGCNVRRMLRIDTPVR